MCRLVPPDGAPCHPACPVVYSTYTHTHTHTACGACAECPGGDAEPRPRAVRKSASRTVFGV
eukprot:631924-Prymnesium_polylepis.1